MSTTDDVQDDDYDGELYRGELALMRLNIIELENKVQFLTADNKTLRSYIAHNMHITPSTPVHKPSRSYTNTSIAKEKLKYYHDMKNIVIHRDQLPDNTPWHIIKRKTDDMFEAVTHQCVSG